MAEPSAIPCSPGCIETPCECGEWLHVVRSPDGEGWYMRHGENLEHRSPLFPGIELFLHGSRDWRAAVHARAG